MFGIKKQEKINMDKTLIDEVLTRGIENIFPNISFVKSKLMSGKKISIYLGIDPTGKTLHLGHIIPLQRLAKLQKLGHQIILLIGDITATIGDPTDKTATRKKLTQVEVMENLKEYKEQASKFISFEGENKALFKFNSEWFGKMSFVDFLELASLATVDQMMKRDMFRVREQEGKQTYIHEIMYPLMQGYDSVAMDVDGEIGGNDQTFNMLTGRDLMKSLKNKEKFVIATKLLIDSSGKKMGKTEGNMVSLDQIPEDMFGKVMSWEDELIIHGFEIITDINLEEIKKMANDMENGVNPKEMKVRLAKEIVKMCYSEKEAERAEKNFEKTFSKGEVPEDILVAKRVGEFWIDTLLSEGLVESKTEARRLITEGALSSMTTKEKITDVNAKAEEGVYKIGKRRFIKIVNK